MNKRSLTQEKCEKLVANNGKKFVTLKEGSELLSIGLHAFRDLAADANAIYRIKRRVLVNMPLVYDFMEAFHEEN